jgi:hypothetical protein
MIAIKILKLQIKKSTTINATEKLRRKTIFAKIVTDDKKTFGEPGSND